jgi:hypothetical protein
MQRRFAMKQSTKFENLSSVERVVRFVIGAGAAVAAMESSLVGGPLFTVVNILAIALATTAILGWDPLKNLTQSAKSALHIGEHRHA